MQAGGVNVSIFLEISYIGGRAQACDDFLDELLSHEVGGEGRVPDIR